MAKAKVENPIKKYTLITVYKMVGGNPDQTKDLVVDHFMGSGQEDGKADCEKWLKEKKYLEDNQNKLYVLYKNL